MTLFRGESKRWRKQDWRFWDTARQSLEYCGEKVIYATEAEAVAMLKIQEERWNIELRTYECPHGDHYHLTSRVY